MENVKILVTENYDQLSEKAASIIAEQINRKPESVIGFATGETPVGTYRHLVKMYKEGKVDFSKITSFNLDEYYPIRKDNSQSYDFFMRKNLFDQININACNINIPNGEAKDPIFESILYEQKISGSGCIELQILGIGLNGHIGFVEPDDFFMSVTGYVKLADKTIEANSRFFSSKDEVPGNALSMGIKTIMMAKKIMLLASGEKKAEIIQKALFGPITPQVPASVLQLHQNVTFVLDREAAKCLKDIPIL